MDGSAAKPIRSLSSSTFVGLLLAQFTATFNDQALHIVAIFFASDIFVRYLNLRGIDEKGVVALVTACFITPFLLFSPLAGELADRFSKRSIIVLWKVVEVVIMAVALVALALPHWIVPGSESAPNLAMTAAVLAAATVFLMGVHSTFFVPAKYGIMPEILDPSILSRGNGLLEGTSFMAQIFGTAAGGLLYSVFKSEIRPGSLAPGHEWFIGLLLLLFSVIGTATAFLMDKVPAANPGKRIDWGWWRPLSANLKLVRQSKPLTLALTGIAFAAFLTLFVRQTLLYDAEQAKEASVVAEMLTRGITGNPEHVVASLATRARAALHEPELQVSLLIALVGFGVGLGSVCAGYLSGDRVELGLVPVGGTILVLLFVMVALLMRSAALLTGLLFLVGVAAGLYIVPLYTLMQHRAPKELKGNVVAASNFINVAGGIASVLLFFTLTFVLERMFGPSTSLAAAAASPEALHKLQAELTTAAMIPQVLFAFTALVVMGTAVRVTLLQPDLDLRLMEFREGLLGCRPHVTGLEHVPADGPVLVLCDCETPASARRMLAVVDRTMHVLMVPDTPDDRSWRTGLWLSRNRIQVREAVEPGGLLARAESLFRQSEMVAVPVDAGASAEQLELVQRTARAGHPILLVTCRRTDERRNSQHCPAILIGPPVSPEGLGAIEHIHQRLDEMRSGRVTRTEAA